MSWRAFLYRRLSRWVTCELDLAGGRLRLASKYDVASFQDVFCTPFYWQLFTLLEEPPRLVVDCGAHCGHFEGIVESCVRARFGRSDARYVVVEPNPLLQPSLRRNLADLGLTGRFEVLEGVVGVEGDARLWFDRRNLLSASTNRSGPRDRSVPVPVVNLSRVLGGAVVDLLKVDIEGAEYRLVEESSDLLRRTRLLMIELHAADPESDVALLARLREAGLQPVSPLVQNGPYRLAAFRNVGLQRPQAPPRAIDAGEGRP
jgi:FkbM family methyltransferase